MNPKMSRQEREETLSGILNQLWHDRKTVLLVLAITYVLGVLIFFISVSKYEAKMLIGPTPQMGTKDDVGSLPLSTVARFNALDGTLTLSSKNSGLFKALATSPRVGKLLLKTPDIRKGIAKDRSGGFLKQDISDWNSQDMSVYLKNNLKINSHVNLQGLFSMAYRHESPEFAESFLRKVHAITDELIRNDYRVLTSDRIVYIQKMLKQTLNPDHREGLTNLLLELEKQKIMVNADQSFSVQVLDPPTASRTLKYPRKGIYFSVLFLVGLVLGCIIVLIRDPIMSQNDKI
ncbi:MAG: hypothetical protein CL565_01440 [Alphaproteobacteria bacterium]|nr:hypothetical protein [Alphaproteobacteria bacterium]|tara:strand:- start:699 stop:1568 length:870 start_codon:yes stop_codon:yes gene_type:complete